MIKKTYWHSLNTQRRKAHNCHFSKLSLKHLKHVIQYPIVPQSPNMEKPGALAIQVLNIQKKVLFSEPVTSKRHV